MGIKLIFIGTEEIYHPVIEPLTVSNHLLDFMTNLTKSIVHSLPESNYFYTNIFGDCRDEFLLKAKNTVI